MIECFLTPLGNSNLLDLFEGSGVLYLQMEGSCMGKICLMIRNQKTLRVHLKPSIWVKSQALQ